MESGTIKEFYLSMRDGNSIPKFIITDSQSAANYIRNFYHDDIEIYESFFILLLNQANQTIGYAKISQGGVCGTVVDPRIIFKFAIDSLCSGIILCHNHPSGNTKPSENDKRLTGTLIDGGRILSINILDHIIITKNKFFSFADNGLI